VTPLCMSGLKSSVRVFGLRSVFGFTDPSSALGAAFPAGVAVGAVASTLIISLDTSECMALVSASLVAASLSIASPSVALRARISRPASVSRHLSSSSLLIFSSSCVALLEGLAVQIPIRVSASVISFVILPRCAWTLLNRRS